MSLHVLEDIQLRLDNSPFIKALQIEAIEWAADETSPRLVLKMPMRPLVERLADSEQMHGGPIASLIATAGCFAVGMDMGGVGLPTIAFSTNYLRPIVKSSATAVATVRRVGKSIGIADVEVMNDAGVLVALGRAEYSTLQR